MFVWKKIWAIWSSLELWFSGLWKPIHPTWPQVVKWHTDETTKKLWNPLTMEVKTSLENANAGHKMYQSTTWKCIMHKHLLQVLKVVRLHLYSHWIWSISKSIPKYSNKINHLKCQRWNTSVCSCSFFQISEPLPTFTYDRLCLCQVLFLCPAVIPTFFCWSTKLVATCSSSCFF